MDTNSTNVTILVLITCVSSAVYYCLKPLFFPIKMSCPSDMDNAFKDLSLDESLCIENYEATSNFLITNIQNHNNSPFSYLSQNTLSGEFPLGYLANDETHSRLNLINTALDSSNLPIVPLGQATQFNPPFEIWNNYMSLSLSEKLNILYLSGKSFFLDYFLTLPPTDKIVTIVYVSFIAILLYKAITGVSALVGATVSYINSSYQKYLLDQTFLNWPLNSDIMLKRDILSFLPHNNWGEFSKILDTIVQSAGLNFQQKHNVFNALLADICRERPTVFLNFLFDRNILQPPINLTRSEITTLVRIKATMSSKYNFFLIANDMSIYGPQQQVIMVPPVPQVNLELPPIPEQPAQGLPEIQSLTPEPWGDDDRDSDY